MAKCTAAQDTMIMHIFLQQPYHIGGCSYCRGQDQTQKQKYIYINDIFSSDSKSLCYINYNEVSCVYFLENG